MRRVLKFAVIRFYHLKTWWTDLCNEGSIQADRERRLKA